MHVLHVLTVLQGYITMVQLLLKHGADCTASALPLACTMPRPATLPGSRGLCEDTVCTPARAPQVALSHSRLSAVMQTPLIPACHVCMPKSRACVGLRERARRCCAAAVRWQGHGVQAMDEHYAGAVRQQALALQCSKRLAVRGLCSIGMILAAE